MLTYTISVADEGDYILIVVKGEINRELALRINMEAHNLGEKHGIDRYFEDLTECRNTDNMTNNYDFAYEDMSKSEDVSQNARVAMLVKHGDHSHDFIETVSINAGLDVRLFHSRETALAYLRR